jgi:hypothetical protein
MDNQNPQKNCTTNTTPHNGENTNIVNESGFYWEQGLHNEHGRSKIIFEL